VNPSCDDGDEMRRDPELDDRTAEDILHGRVAALEGDDRMLAEAMTALRAEARTPPRPSAQLLEVFSEGVGEQAVPVACGMRGGSRRTERRPVARLAGLGLLTKAVLAGTAAAAVAIAGAGAAGVLPDQPNDPPPAGPAEESEADVGLDIADEATRDRVVGQDVADEVRQMREHAAQRDEAGDESGQEARDLRGENSQPGLDRAGEHTDRAPGSVPESDGTAGERADDRTGDTPAEQRGSDTPAPRAPPPGPGTGASGEDDGITTDRRVEAPRQDSDQRP
jgi:hypothetical protein